MAILVILICLICAVEAFNYKDRWNPQTLFCGFIGFIILLSTINYTRSTSLLTYFITILGVVSFSSGVHLSSRNSVVSHLKDRSTYILNNKMIFYLVIIMLAWTISRVMTTVLPLLMSGYSLDYIRMVYFGSEVDGVESSRLDGIIEVFVNQPFMYALMPIGAYEITKPKGDRQLKPVTIILILTWVCLSCLVTGGRALMFYFVVVIFFAFIISGKYSTKEISANNSNKLKRIVGFAVVGLLIYLIYLYSVLRNSENQFDFTASIYSYFSGCVPHTSMRLATEKIDYTFGMTFLSGLLRPIMLLYKYTIGGGAFPDLYQQTLDIAVKLQEVVMINGDEYNAFVLPFYFFYYDGDVVGVIIESIIYGYFCGRAYFRLKNDPSHKNVCKYLVILIYIFSSMVRFSPYIVSMMYAYIYVRLCYKKI